MEGADNSLAKLDPHYPFANGRNLARAVGKRHDAELCRTATAAFEDHQVAVIEREPQFYLLSADPAEDCISCVSRILKGGRPWYVIEDGLGGLLAEGYSLNIL